MSIGGSILILGLLASSPSCLILPIPHPNYIVRGRPGVAGPEAGDFIRAAETSREDVLLKLGEPDLAWGDDRVLAYCWSDSTVGILFVVGGQYSGRAEWIDLECSHMLLIAFDKGGKVVRSEVVLGSIFVSPSYETLYREWTGEQVRPIEGRCIPGPPAAPAALN